MQAIKRSAVVREVLGLASHRRFPTQAQPGEVFVDRGFVVGPAARAIDVLDAQQEAIARIGGEKRGVSVPEVEQPRWERGEARDNGHGAA